MSDTATTEKPKREFDVNYTLEIVDELPAPLKRGGGGGVSPLNEQIEKVKAAVNEDSEKIGKWFLVGRYGQKTAAGAAANVLRQRFGRDATADGLVFAVRPIGEHKDSRGLFVAYDPSKIVPGALDEHKRAEEKRLSDLARRRQEKRQANGSTSTETENVDGNVAAAQKAQNAAKKAAR